MPAAKAPGDSSAVVACASWWICGFPCNRALPVLASKASWVRYITQLDARRIAMDLSAQALAVSRGPFQLYAEMTPGPGVPVVLMHGFPDNTHLYDRLLPQLAGTRPVVRFDFLGWGRSDKPEGYPYTSSNQTRDLAAVIEAVSAQLHNDQVVLVAHDASGPPAIDWALANPERVAGLVLLNTYYQWTPWLRRPPAIALYSTPVLGAAARAVVRRWPDLDRRLYAWQVGGFIQDPEVRAELVDQLYKDFLPARPAFWRLNDDLLPTVFSRLRRVADMRRFAPPVRVIFGARDRYLNARVARRFAALFPNSELHLLEHAGHYVQVDEPGRVADLITAERHQAKMPHYSA
jgi:haloalkane dehalogenase